MFKIEPRPNLLIDGVASILKDRYHVERISCERIHSRQAMGFSFMRGDKRRTFHVNDRHMMNEEAFYQEIGDKSRLEASKLNVWPNLLTAE